MVLMLGITVSSLGSNIKWRYKTSIRDHLQVLILIGPSATVSCATPSVSASQGSCSSGSANITMELDNTGQGAKLL